MEMFKDASFIKALSETNSLNQLLFPDEFVLKYGEILPESAFLITEEKFGTCWKVKVARLDDGRVCFANGWPEFVLENPQISASDYLVFELVDPKSFIVSVFGHDGLKKPSATLRLPRPSTPPLPPTRDVVVNNRRTKRNQSVCTERQYKYRSCERGVEVDGIKSFTVLSLSKNQFYYLNIPTCFGEGTGIAERSSVWLKNEKDESWLVTVCTRERDGRKCLRGLVWENFWKTNCLTVGNTITFSIVGCDFGTLHVSREGFIVPTPPKKITGRPRKFF